MSLKGIRLFGFKSFYRKVELDFGTGITAIVGPNGCGKSNVADAIRWVLGEQNPRVLRGKRMEDTIFKGTQTRKPLNMTEVNLLFDNRNGTVSLPYEEIMITRKLFRSGESVYLINNVECRLKDVADLITDLSIGKDAYSLIEQRMIDAILNGKSGERRQVLEDAAGIVKYKERKRLAMKRLERTRQDLEQIQVLVDEVERSVQSLKRHAGKARRYSAYRGREKEIELTLSRREFEEFKRQGDEIRTRLQGQENDRRSIQAAIRELEEGLLSGKAEISSREDEIGRLREDVKGRSQTIKDLDERLAILRERMVHRRERGERIGGEIGDQMRSVETLAREREELKAGSAAGLSRLAEISDELNRLGAERAELEGALEEQTSQSLAREAEWLERLERVSESKARLNAVEKELVSLTERMEILGSQIAEKRSRIQSAGGERNVFLENISDLRAIVDQMSSRLDKLSRLKEKVSRRRANSDQEIQKWQLHLNNCLAQIELQEKWQEAYEGYPVGVASVMRARDRLPGIIGPLGELVEIEEGFARAIETGLGAYMKMIVTEDRQSALTAIEFLKEKGVGLASFLPLEQVRSTGGRKEPTPPARAIACGADVVSCEPRLQALRDLLLGDLWIVPPALDGGEIEGYFQTPARIVSLDGSLLKEGISLSGGGESNEDLLILQRSRRIEELRGEATGLRTALERAEAYSRRWERLFKGAGEEQGMLERRSTERSELLKGKEVILLGLESEDGHLQGDVLRLEEELQRLSGTIEAREREAKELRDRLAEAEAGIGAPGEPSQVGLREIRERKGRIDRAVEGYRIEEATVRSLLSESDKRSERIEQELKSREEILNRLRGEQAAIEAEIIALRDEETKAREERDRAISEARKREEEMAGVEDGMRHARNELERQEAEIATRRLQLDAMMAEIQRLGLEENNLKNQLNALVARIDEKYGIEFPDRSLQGPDEEPSLQELRAELADLRSKIATLGHVNFVALEEYEAEEKRLELLVSQRDDLLGGKEALERTIRKINRIARDRFLATFDRVRENFQETFRVLFSGGRADLVLGDGDDPLECEIDMVAQPFGKRLESVDLLSGGERALTALALLFAIYRVRPSPFCILDEADAALDDANVSRLLDMLARFRQDTQFIIITHNKKTMSAADCLYGVTMEEPGVSKVVSVTLDGIRREEGIAEPLEESREERASVQG